MRNEFANNYIIETIMKSPSLQLFCFLGERVRDTFTDQDLEEQDVTVLDVMNPEHRKYIRLNFGRKFLDHQTRLHQLNHEAERETMLREYVPPNAKPRDSMDILNQLWPAEMHKADSKIPHPDRPTLLKLKDALERRSKLSIYDRQRTKGKGDVKLITVPEQRAQQLEFERTLQTPLTTISSRNPSRTGFFMRERALMKGGVKKLMEEEAKEIQEMQSKSSNGQNGQQPTPAPIKRRTILRPTSRPLAQIIQDGDYVPELDVPLDATVVQPKVLLKPEDGDEITMENQIFEIALDPLMMGMLHPHIPLHKIRNLLYKQIKRNKEPPSIASDYVHILINQLAKIPTCSVDLPMINGISRAQGLIQQSAAAVGLSGFTDRNSTFLETHSLAMTMSHIISRTLDFPQKFANDYYEWKVYEQHQMDAIAVLRTASDVFQLALNKHKSDVGDAIDETRKRKELQIRHAFLRKVKRGDPRYHPEDINRLGTLDISDSEDEFSEDKKARTEVAIKVQNGELPPIALDKFAHLDDGNLNDVVVSTPSFAFLQLPSKILHLDMAQGANQQVKLDEIQTKQQEEVKQNKLRPTTMLLPYIDFLNHPMNSNQHNVYLTFDTAETSVIGDENEVQKRRDELKKNLALAPNGGDDDNDNNTDDENARVDPENYEIDPVTGQRTSKLRKEQSEDPSKMVETMISNDDIDYVQRLIIAMQVEIEDLERQVQDDFVLKVAHKLPLTNLKHHQQTTILRPTQIRDKVLHLEKNIKMLEKALDVIQAPNKVVMANVVARRDIFPGEELLLAYHRLDDSDPHITSVSEVIPHDKHGEVLTLQHRQMQQSKQLGKERQRHKEQMAEDLKAGTKEIQNKYDAEIMKTLKKIKSLESDLTHLQDLAPAEITLHPPGSIEAVAAETQRRAQQSSLESRRREITQQLNIARSDKELLFDTMHSEVTELHRQDKFQQRQEELNEENYRWTQMTPQQLLLNYGIVMPHLHLSPVALQQLDDQSLSGASQGGGLGGSRVDGDRTNPLSNKQTKLKDYLSIQQQRKDQLKEQQNHEKLAAQDAVIHAKMVSHGAIPILDQNQAIPVSPDGTPQSHAHILLDDNGDPMIGSDGQPVKKSTTTTITLRKQSIGEQMEEEVTSNIYNINPHIEPFSLVLNMEEASTRHMARKGNQMDFIPDVGLKDKLKIIKNAKEIIETDGLLLESREMLQLINLKVARFSDEVFQDLDDVKMGEIQRHMESQVQVNIKNDAHKLSQQTINQRAKDSENGSFTYDQRLQILKDRITLEGVIERLENRRDELDYVTKQGMTQTSLTELLFGSTTKTIPSLHASLAPVNVWANKYGYSSVVDRKTKKVLRHVDTNLEDVIHFSLDDIYQYKNNLYPPEVYRQRQQTDLYQEEIADYMKEQRYNKYNGIKMGDQDDDDFQQLHREFGDLPDEIKAHAEQSTQLKKKIAQTTFLDDIMSIPDKDARGTLLACRLLYETIATTWLEQVVLKDFVTPWEQVVRPKHVQLFSKYAPTNKSHQYQIKEDISFARRGHNIQFRDVATEQQIAVMKDFMLSKIPHPLQLMDQAYKSIWLDNSIENTNKRKLTERITRKTDEQRLKAMKKGQDKELLREVVRRNGHGDGDNDEEEEEESTPDQYDVDRNFYLDVGEDEDESENPDPNFDPNQPPDPKELTKSLRKRFDANQYLNEVNTLYENINYKVQTHIDHEDFGNFVHMTSTCEMLGAYRKQQLDTMIYIYTHFYDKLERL